MFRTALRKIGTYFIELTEGSSTPARPHGRNGTTISTPHDFADRTRGMLRQGASGRRTFLAASVQLVGLEEIRRTLGERWSSVAGIAKRVAEETIREFLGEQDTFERQSEESFIVCFAGADKDQATAKTREIVDAIRGRLDREAPDHGLTLDHTVAELEWGTRHESGESLISVIADQLRQIRGEADAASKAWRRELLKNAIVMYSPIWNSEKGIVALYRCLLDEETGRQVLRRFGAISGPDEVRAAAADLDFLMVGRAMQALHSLLSDAGTAQLVIPVNFNVLNDRNSREAYLKLCRDIPDAYRPHLLFELHSTPVGTPSSRILEISLALKQYSYGVIVEIPLSLARLRDLAASSIHGVSINAKALGGTIGDSAARLGRLAASARVLNLKSFVYAVDTLGYADAVLKTQVDFVEGRAIAPCLPGPKTAHFWTVRPPSG